MLSARVSRCVVALVLAIGAAGCAPDSDGPDRADPRAWSPEVSLAREPSLSTFEVEEAIQTWLPALLRLEIAEAQGAYRDITSRFSADPACPPYVEEHSGEGYTTRYWGYYQEEGSCTTSSGDWVNAMADQLTSE